MVKTKKGKIWVRGSEISRLSEKGCGRTPKAKEKNQTFRIRDIRKKEKKKGERGEEKREGKEKRKSPKKKGKETRIHLRTRFRKEYPRSKPVVRARGNYRGTGRGTTAMRREGWGDHQYKERNKEDQIGHRGGVVADSEKLHRLSGGGGKRGELQI